MTCRASRLLVLLAGAVVAIGAAAAPPKPKKEPTVVKYVGAKRGRAWGRPCMILIVAPRQGGGGAQLIVPNRDPMARKFDPSPIVVEVVRELKPGDLIQITTAKFRGKNILRRIQRYKLKPGEDDPLAFTLVKVVERKLGTQKYLAAELKKGPKSQVLLIPNRRDEQGKLAADTQLAEQVRGFNEGDLVEVKVEKVGGRAMLKSIKAYEAPERGKFVKLTPKKVGEKKVLAVEVNSGEQPQVLLIPNVENKLGNLAPDANMAAPAKKFRAGQHVLFKTREEDGQTWLTEIRAALW